MTEQTEKSSAKYTFTRDYFSSRTESWRNQFGSLSTRSVSALEIGSLEGRSAIWTLENLLIHPDSRLTCIDVFNNKNLEKRFDQNIQLSGCAHKVRKLKGESWKHLRRQQASAFDFIYIDGSHYGRDVIEDGVLSYRLLKKGGFLVFDDYPWEGNPNHSTYPREAIDAFLTLYQDSFVILEKKWQVLLKRVD